MECIWRESPASFLEKHEGWTITMVGFVGTGLGVLLSFFLRSRCTKIRCCGLSCDRTPLTADELSAIEAQSPRSVIETPTTEP